MTLSEAIASARKILNDYSLNGEVIDDNYNGTKDTKLRMVYFADLAQKELARSVAKVERSFRITHMSLDNLVPGAGFAAHRNKGENIVFSPANTARAFSIEVDDICSITISVNGVNTVYAVNDKPEGFQVVKDVIMASDGDSVTMTISGDYPFHYRGAALYTERFRTADDVPVCSEFFSVDTPYALWQYKPRGIRFIGDKTMAGESAPYFIEDKTLYLLGTLDGEWEIRYYAMPEDIKEDTADTYEFEIPFGEEAIPLKMAYLCALDIGNVDATVLAAMKNEYAQTVNGMTLEPAYTTRAIRNVY